MRGPSWGHYDGWRRPGRGPQQILGTIRASPYVCADETGLREDGTNSYLWSFSTPTTRYYVRGSRHKEMLDDVLGPTFAGVLSSDFYAAYDHYTGPHQRCWAHLLRESHTLRERHPQDRGLRQWAAQVHGVYTRARRCRAARADTRERAQRRFEQELLAVCAPFLEADKAVVPQAVVCRRVHKYLTELFSFVADPQVDSTNRRAERDIRPTVVQRKISGGTRSPQGTDTFTILHTLFGSWRAQNLDSLVACQQMLRPQPAALL